MTPEDFKNTKINAWLHIHGLPFEFRGMEYVKCFVNYAGSVRNTNRGKGHREARYEGEFMKVRIELDTNEPILPDFFFKRVGRLSTWIPMKYERLPNVCFCCGRMGHGTRLCKEKHKPIERRFDGWLNVEEKTKFSPAWSEEKSEGS